MYVFRMALSRNIQLAIKGAPTGKTCTILSVVGRLVGTTPENRNSSEDKNPSGPTVYSTLVLSLAAQDRRNNLNLSNRLFVADFGYISINAVPACGEASPKALYRDGLSLAHSPILARSLVFASGLEGVAPVIEMHVLACHLVGHKEKIPK